MRLTILPSLVGAVLLAAVGIGEPKEAPPLPPPQGSVQTVNDAAQLVAAVEKAGDDTTILIADGTYRLPRLIYMRGKKNMTVRGASGDPDKVVLCGKGWDSEDKQDDILRIGDCENVTVAHLTFSDCHSYGVKVQAEDNPRNIHIYNCHFRDIGIRMIKGSGAAGRRGPCARGGSIRFCHFENTRIPPAHWLYGGNYISAIDMMALDGWTISDNVFKNIKGCTGGGRAAIFIWVLSRNVTVERNLIVDCDRGVAFGNPSISTSKVGEEEFHMQNGICRNNFIVPGPDAGIELWWVDGAKIYSNTIWRRDVSGRGIRCGSRLNNVRVADNLVRGQILNEGDKSESHLRLEKNLAGSLDGWFVNPAAGDLHLTKLAVGALHAAVPLPEVVDDFDGRPRGTQPDIGASEFDARR